MLFPTEVGVGDKDIEKLTNLYKRAYKKILGEIEGATDFGIYNRNAILGQIEGILAGLGTDVQEFIDYEIPHNYKVGADQSVRQLKSYGQTIIVDQGFNLLHQEAIENLISDTSRAFATSLTAIKKSGESVLSMAEKEEIKFRLAEGSLSGEALRTIKSYIKNYLQDEGLSALIDKAGRSWTLDRYTEMLIRTKSAEARNTGLINRSVENGFDLVEVTDHNAKCDLCGKWEGKILSLTGKTKGYPTLEEAKSEGLFHPNCKHAINNYNIEIAKMTRSFNPNTGKYEIQGTDSIWNPIAKPVTKKEPKVVKNSNTGKGTPITISYKKEKFTIDSLKKWESDFIKDNNIVIRNGSKVGTYGYSRMNPYTRLPEEIVVNIKALQRDFGDSDTVKKKIEQIFYHEFGHTVDYGYTKSFDNLTARKFKYDKENPVWKALLADKEKIVDNRLRESYLGEKTDWVAKWGLTEEKYQDLVKGNTISLRNKQTGNVVQTRLTLSKLDYYNSETEVFADAYNQYRNKKDFAKEAPEFYKLFEDLTKNYGK